MSTEFPGNRKIDTESAPLAADGLRSLHPEQPEFRSQSQATTGRPVESIRNQPDTVSKYLPAVEIIQDPAADRTKFIEAMAATIRKATRRDQWIDTGTDEKAIFLTLSDLSEADRKSLGTYYQKRYGISLSKEFEREMSGADLARANALLDRKDTSNGDAGYIHSLLVEANQLIVGRSKANIAQVVRDKLSSLSASDIEKVDSEYKEAYGKGLRSALYNDVRFNKSSQESFDILLKGADKMTTFDHLKFANIALSAYDAEMFQQAMTHASPEARRLFIAADGEEKVRQAFAGHWYHSLTAGLSGNVTNTELRHTQDYLKDGRLSAASKLKDNTSWLGDNEKAIEDALMNISDRERHSYQAVRKAILDGKEPLQSNLPVYTDLQKLFRSYGNETERAAWEAMIIYPGSTLSKELLAHRGLIMDSGIERVTNSLEHISHNDFQLLKTDPMFRKDMEGLLATFMSDSQMLRVKESFGKLQACQKFDDVHVSGKRSVLNSIQDNHGYVWTNKQAIVEGLAKMSPQEQTQYREDSSFRAEVDTKAAAALGWSHGDAGKAILERVLKQQNPAITVLEKLSMEAAKFNIDEGQVIRDVQQAFREHPEMRHAVTTPKNEAEKEFSQKFMKELESCLDANEFARYAKPLLETGTLPIDIQNEMDDWFWHTNKKNLVKNIFAATGEQRELLLSADKTNKAAMELQTKVFGELDERTGQFAKTVLKQRAYAPEDRLRSFVLGLGVPKEEAFDLMSRLANEQKQKIFMSYAAKYGSNLSSDVMAKVKRPDRDEIEITARSHTLSADEQLNAVLDDHSTSRRGLGKFFVDSTWDGTGFQSDEARNLMVQAMRKASLQGTDLPADEATKFSMRTLSTITNFRQSKGKFGDAATDIAITALAIGGAYFTAGGSLSLLTKTSIAAAVGAAVKVGGKAMASGSDYDWTPRQVGLDGGVGMIYGAFTFLGSQQLAKALNVGGAAGLKAAGLAQASLTRMAGQGGAQLIGEGSEAVIQEGLTTIARDMLLRNASKVPMEALTALAAEVATQGNEEAVKVALQISLAQALKQQGLSTATKVAIEYGLPAASGGIAGGAAGTIRGASEWDPDLPVDENLGNVGKNAVNGAGMGSLSALTFKVGTKALAVGYEALSQYGADQLSNPDAYISDRADDIGIFQKQPVILKAIQVDAPTTIQTMEGPVPANSGDWILTGVRGEQWPVRPDIFARSYDPVAGAVDMFQKKPIEVLAVQIDRAMSILDPAGATYQGSSGDWLVIGLSGNKYFVKPEIFASTYGAVDRIAQRVTLSAAAIPSAQVIVGNASGSLAQAAPPNPSQATLFPASTEPDVVDSDTLMKSVKSVYYTGVRRLTNQLRASERDRLPLVRKAPSVRQTAPEPHETAPQ